MHLLHLGLTAAGEQEPNPCVPPSHCPGVGAPMGDDATTPARRGRGRRCAAIAGLAFSALFVVVYRQVLGITQRPSWPPPGDAVPPPPARRRRPRRSRPATVHDGAVAWTGGAGIEDHFKNGGFHGRWTARSRGRSDDAPMARLLGIADPGGDPGPPPGPPKEDEEGQPAVIDPNNPCCSPEGPAAKYRVLVGPAAEPFPKAIAQSPSIAIGIPSAPRSWPLKSHRLPCFV